MGRQVTQHQPQPPVWQAVLHPPLWAATQRSNKSIYQDKSAFCKISSGSRVTKPFLSGCDAHPGNGPGNGGCPPQQQQCIGCNTEPPRWPVLHQTQTLSDLASSFQQHGVTLANTKCMRQQNLDTAVKPIWQNMQKCTPTAFVVRARD